MTDGRRNGQTDILVANAMLNYVEWPKIAVQQGFSYNDLTSGPKRLIHLTTVNHHHRHHHHHREAAANRCATPTQLERVTYIFNCPGVPTCAKIKGVLALRLISRMDRQEGSMVSSIICDCYSLQSYNCTTG